MRKPRLRLEVLRFRELDGRARQALATMLRSLTASPAAPPVGASAPSAPDEVLDDIGDLVERAGPLGSRVAHFAARLTDVELTLVLTQPSPDEPDHRRERVLARVLRMGPESFRLSPAADPIVRDLDSLPSSKDPDRDA